MGRDVGVEDLEGFEGPVNDWRPVGVAGLEAGPPADKGLRNPVPEVFNPGDDVGCQETELLLVAVSGWEFANLDFSTVGRTLGASGSPR